MPNAPDRKKSRIDVLGALLVVTATSCLLVGLTWGGNQVYPWESLQVIGTLVASLLLYLCFFLMERYAVEPVVPLNLFRNQIFTAASLLALLRGMGLLGLTTYLPLFFQGVLGIPAANAGVLLTPLTVSLVVGSILSRS